MGKILEINQNCWIVIPAFNEGKVICDVIQPLIQEGYQVVVVDDGSSDGSPEKVIDLDLHFCRHTINLGQGAALQTGIQLALKNNALYIVTFDGDGQHRAEDVKKVARTPVNRTMSGYFGLQIHQVGRCNRNSLL